MFRGVNNITVDEKGRMVMPTRYRSLVKMNSDGQLIVTIDTEEKCLLLYPLVEWEDIEKKVEALPSFNQYARRIQRLLLGHATDVNMDSNGRLLLPQPLREYAALDKHVVLVGQGKKFELWDEAHWQAQREDWLNITDSAKNDLPDELKALSL